MPFTGGAGPRRCEAERWGGSWETASSRICIRATPPAREPARFAYGPRPARVLPPNATDPLAPSRAPCAGSFFTYPVPPLPPSSPIAQQKPTLIYMLDPAPPLKERGAFCKNPCHTVRAVRMRPIPPCSPPAVFAYQAPPVAPAGPTPALSGEHGGALTAGGGGGAGSRVGLCPSPRIPRHSYSVSTLRGPTAPAKGTGCWVSLGALGACPGPGRGLAGLSPTPGQGLTVNQGRMSPHGSCAAPAPGSWLWSRLRHPGQCQAGLQCLETWTVLSGLGDSNLGCVFPPDGRLVGLGPGGPFS